MAAVAISTSRTPAAAACRRPRRRRAARLEIVDVCRTAVGMADDAGGQTTVAAGRRRHEAAQCRGLGWRRARRVSVAKWTRMRDTSPSPARVAAGAARPAAAPAVRRRARAPAAGRSARSAASRHGMRLPGHGCVPQSSMKPAGPPVGVAWPPDRGSAPGCGAVRAIRPSISRSRSLGSSRPSRGVASWADRHRRARDRGSR